MSPMRALPGAGVAVTCNTFAVIELEIMFSSLSIQCDGK